MHIANSSICSRVRRRTATLQRMAFAAEFLLTLMPFMVICCGLLSLIPTVWFVHAFLCLSCFHYVSADSPGCSLLLLVISSSSSVSLQIFISSTSAFFVFICWWVNLAVLQEARFSFSFTHARQQLGDANGVVRHPECIAWSQRCLSS